MPVCLFCDDADQFMVKARCMWQVSDLQNCSSCAGLHKRRMNSEKENINVMLLYKFSRKHYANIHIDAICIDF